MTKQVHFAKPAVLSVAACLLTMIGAQAQDGRGARPSAPPWYAPGYRGYHESPATTPRSGLVTTPQRYTLRVTALAMKDEDDPNAALIMAHLPEDASIWFQGAPTQQTGTLRHFRTPQLSPSKEYVYTTRVQWHEGGKWVTQIHTFPVRAGDVHCIDIVPTDSPDVQQDVAANLAKLDPQDRTGAEAQRFCAVQEGIRLGSMGVPFKVVVNSETVFVCCDGCADKARTNADKTLEQVKKLKAKYAAATAP
jgi:uncharacterized protein (TIGR03000 family)